MPPTLQEHLSPPGPKRILALDGGGVRGVLTLEYLARMERILAQRAGNPNDFRLCDYFDLIGGTSTGSIIAACLALGYPVTELQALYRELAGHIFEQQPWRFGLLASKFPRTPLARALRQHFGDKTVGSDRLRTGLMIMTKRLDTGSPWPVHNNPRGAYYDQQPGSQGLANKDFLLRDVVRASTAAPTYFKPERLKVSVGDAGAGIEGAFIDGGVSPSNNPALQLLLLATLKGYGFRWPLGTDQLLIVSLGTGHWDLRLTTDEVMQMTAVMLARSSLVALMDDCSWLGQTLLQWLGKSPTLWPIDSEVGNLRDDSIDGQKLLTYIRYDVNLERSWLSKLLGDHDALRIRVEALRAMDKPANVRALARIGEAAAKVQVQAAHFPEHFDPITPAPA